MSDGEVAQFSGCTARTRGHGEPPQGPAVDLFADRTSCRRFWSNLFRQLPPGLAYTLIEGVVPLGTEAHGTPQ